MTPSLENRETKASQKEFQMTPSMVLNLARNQDLAHPAKCMDTYIILLSSGMEMNIKDK